MTEARYDVANMRGVVIAENTTAAVATLLVNAYNHWLRVRFHADDSCQKVPWPLPLEIADRSSSWQRT